jgi:ferredoxin
MKVIVDRDLCEANAVCVSKAPEVFDVDEEGRMVLRDERPAPALAAKVRLAVERCPRGALSIEDE